MKSIRSLAIIFLIQLTSLTFVRNDSADETDFTMDSSDTDETFDFNLDYDYTSDDLNEVSEHQFNEVYIHPWKYDDYEDYSINEIRAYAEQDLEQDGNYTREEALTLLDTHNELRANEKIMFDNKAIPPMKNMQFMEYDNVLDWISHLFNNYCVYGKHFIPEGTNISIAQNLFFGPMNDPAFVAKAWYSELEYLDVKNRLCMLEHPTPSYTCGHFIQVMWHRSKFVGCAKKYCFPLMKKWVVSCHYTPPGYIPGQFPFDYGTPCNGCPYPFKGLCYRNQCVDERICNGYQLEGCKCNADCQNCGVPNPVDCECTCPAGWDGTDCATPCENASPLICGVPKRVSTLRHCDLNNQKPRHYTCRKYCQTCKTLDPLKKYDMCCQGVHCPDGYVLNEEDCHCILECPGRLCIFNKTGAPYEISPPIHKSPTTPASEKNGSSFRSLNYRLIFLFGTIYQLTCLILTCIDV